MTFDPALLAFDFNWLYAFSISSKTKAKLTSEVQLAFTFQLRFGCSDNMGLSFWSLGISLLWGLQLNVPIPVKANDFSSFLSANASLGKVNELRREWVS